MSSPHLSNNVTIKAHYWREKLDNFRSAGLPLYPDGKDALLYIGNNSF